MPMKMFFIETKANVSVEFPAELAKKLPRRLCLAASVQFSHQLPQLQQFLEKHGKEASLLKARHSKHAGQILGCGYSKMEFDAANTDAFLYVGDGMFHPEALLLGSGKDVYTFDPFTKEFRKLGKEWADRVRKKEKGALLTFLSSDRVGVVVTVKPGQLGVQVTLKSVFSLPQLFPEKKFHYLVCDTIDFTQLQNFPFVQCFINTACHRMIDDYDKFPKPVINIEEVLKLAPKEQQQSCETFINKTD